MVRNYLPRLFPLSTWPHCVLVSWWPRTFAVALGALERRLDVDALLTRKDGHTRFDVKPAIFILPRCQTDL